ncbi:MAG: hypothetical protein HFI37_00970, partial [Lachnospiraceae bacterium]|nr:hypothetical protein [Lachnospiraceae bacterium]
WQLLFSKLIVSFIWLSIEILLVALSIFCIFANHDLFKAVSDYLAVYGGLASFIKMITGMNIVLFWVNMVIFFILSVLNTILLPYASICIGQLWQRHKLAGSFLSYIVIQIVLQIISFIYTIFKMANITTFNAENYFPMSFYAFSLILTLITSIIYFVICGTVMKKKINLD